MGSFPIDNPGLAFTLTVIPDPSIPGDANVDGKVDLTDLSIVLNNFGKTTSHWTDGNFDETATIDLTDLSDVLNHLGQSNASSFVAFAPEPTSTAFLLLGSSLALAGRSRVRSPRKG